MARDESQRERFERLVEEIVTRKYPYEPKDAKPINWSKYTEAQVRELNATLELIRDAVDTIAYTPSPAPTGRPRQYDVNDLAKVLLLQAFFGCSNRLASGYALVFREKLDLKRDVHYKAIERAYDDSDVREILRRVFELTQETEKPYAEGFTIDGSGLPRDAKGNWERDKHTPDAKQDRFAGSILMVTVPHQIVTAHVPFPVGFGSESPHLKTLVQRTAATYGTAFTGIVSADAAYLSRDNCQLIHDAGGVPRIFPKRGIRLQYQGLSAWRRMQTDLLANPQAWLRDYHQRSLSEAYWSRHKRRYTHPLRKRIPARLHTEQHAQITTGNLARLAGLSITEGVKLGPLRRAAG